MAEQAPRTRQELVAGLIERAAKDEAFRRALVADPRGTLERELQAKMPEGFSLTVLEETPTARYLVLPPGPSREGDALSAIASQTCPARRGSADREPIVVYAMVATAGMMAHFAPYSAEFREAYSQAPAG